MGTLPRGLLNWMVESPAKEEKRNVVMAGTRHESEAKISVQEESYLVLARSSTGGFFIQIGD